MSKFLILGISAGLNRAGVFLLFPLLGFFISKTDFGQLSLYLTLSSLFVALFSFNVTSIIAREIHNDLRGVLAYVKCIFYWLTISLFLTAFLFFFTKDELYIYLFFVSFESIFLVVSTYARYRVSDYLFFKVTCIKFFLLITLTVAYMSAVDKDSFDIGTLLFYLAISNAIALPIFFRIIKLSYHGNLVEYLKTRFNYVVFASGLISHVFFLWVNSGSDRFFVKWYFDPETLGVYSFSYSLSAVFMLVNAALSLALPQISVTNHDDYCSAPFRKKLLFVLVTLYLGFCVFLWLLIPYFDTYQFDMVFSLSLLIVSGLFLLCYYTYFSAILFFRRKIRLISTLTFSSTLTTVLLLYPLSKIFGLWGTALVTYLCYMFYALTTCIYTEKGALKYMLIPILFTFPIVCLSYYYH